MARLHPTGLNFRRGCARFGHAVVAVALLMAVVVGLAGFAATKKAAAKPARIVSMNLCTDQLVMLLASHDRIASVSYLAIDRESSAMAETADKFNTNHGLAEEVMQMAPDLVLTGAFTMRPTLLMLRKLGYRIVEVPMASGLDDIRSNIRLVADAVGEPARGEAMISAFDHRLSSLRPATAVGPRPTAILYWANGYISGDGSLPIAVIEAAGFRNVGNEAGVAGSSQLSLEKLLLSEVDVLVKGWEREPPALANQIFRHPALTKSFAARPQVSIANKYWVCGTPFVADAIARLSEVREAWQAGTRQAGTLEAGK